MPPTRKTVRSKSAKLTKTQLAARALTSAKLGALFHPNAATEHDLPFLGYARAVIIVTAAAKTDASNLPRTLAQLGVNGISFQKSVFKGVKAAGYEIGMDAIPNADDTKLSGAAKVIQNAPRQQ